eukprot:scaffold916_cov129-Skeletonema_menzelii.AAC.1
MDMDWNKLKVHKRSYMDIVKERLGPDENGEHPDGLKNTFKRLVTRDKKNEKGKLERKNSKGYTEQFVTDQVLRQILLGENLLEIVYPDISIDTDNENCPRCNMYLSDDDVVAGWSAGNSQEYKTECPNCLTKFVPHFCVQSTLPSFVGSRGPNSPLFCERLSPWVLKKELRSVVSGGIDDLLSPEWRERESKNAGSFSSSLIAPTPSDEADARKRKVDDHSPGAHQGSLYRAGGMILIVFIMTWEHNCWSSSSTFHLGGCYYCCHSHIPIDECSDSIGAQPLLICNLPRQYDSVA